MLNDIISTSMKCCFKDEEKIQPVFLYLIQSPTTVQHKPFKYFEVLNIN